MLALITGTSFLAMITSHSNECMHACMEREHVSSRAQRIMYFGICARATYKHEKVHFECAFYGNARIGEVLCYALGINTCAHAMSKISSPGGFLAHPLYDMLLRY